MSLARWFVTGALVAAACSDSASPTGEPDAGTPPDASRASADAALPADPDAAAATLPGCDDDDVERVVHIGADGEATDLTEEFAAGTTESPAEIAIADDGVLALCAGEYVARVEVEALDLEVKGIEGRDQTSISGGDEDAGAVFSILSDGARFTLNGVTIEDGADVHGGGVYGVGYDLELELSSCAFRGNRALGTEDDGGFGGAVFVDGRGLTVTSCTFEENAATGPGGAIAALADTAIEDGAFSANEAFQGGAVAVIGRKLEVDDTSFEQNGADAGGAVFVKDGDARIASSTLRENTRTTVEIGGGVVVTGGDLSLSDTAISDHLTRSNGGGVSVYEGDLTIEGGSFSGNTTVRFINTSPSLLYGYGGAVFVKDGLMSCDGTSFSGNQAVWGPAIWGEREAAALEVSGTSCSFADNSRISTNADTSTVHLLYDRETSVRLDPEGDATFRCARSGCDE